MDHVVYLLGAGFSAPLGLPVMSNFLIKSKDLFASDPTRYSHFAEVFDKINKMAVAKNYFATDLFNIEEILSILEMNAFVDAGAPKGLFTKFITDVILHFTPKIEPYQGELPTNWQRVFFGREALWNAYGLFGLNLCNAVLHQEPNGMACSKYGKPSASYSVITLNYDLVLENVIKFVGERCMMGSEVGFGGPGRKKDLTLLAKLHGSVNGDTIVPPTWSKGTHPEIVPAWNEARKSLRTANYIRVIGYSLPTADAYIRYLLKAAVLEATNLKGIDVLCRDPDGSVRRRFDEFISFAYYRFADADTREYLEHYHKSMYGSSRDLRTDWYDRLEEAHSAFFESRPGKRTDLRKD